MRSRVAGLLLSVLWAPFSVAANSWRVDWAPEATRLPLNTLDEAIPLADGGFLISGNDPQFRSATLRYDANGRLRDWQFGAGYAVYPARDGGVEILAQFNDGLYTPNPLHLCSLDRDFVGLDARRYSDMLFPIERHVTRGALGPGRFGMFDRGRAPEQVSHFGADCQRTDVTTFDYAYGLTPTWSGTGAYALGQTRAAGSDPWPHRLTRLNASAVEWSLQLPATSAFYNLIRATADGVLIADSERILRVADDGQLRWQAALDAQGLGVAHVADDGNGAYVVLSRRDPASGLSMQRVQGYDNQGALRWRVEPRDERLGQPLRGFPDSGPFYATRLNAAGNWDGTWRLVSIAADGSWIERLPHQPGRTPLAQLRSGAILLADIERRGPLEILDPGSGQRQRVALPSIPAATEVSALEVDGDSVFALSQSSDGLLQFVHRSAAGTLRWQRTLPIPPGALRERWTWSARYAVATNRERVCLWRLAGENAALTCLRRDTGERQFDWIAAPALAAVLFKFDGEGLATVALRCTREAQYGFCHEARVVQRRIDATGHPIEERDVLTYAVERASLSGWTFPDSSGAVFTYTLWGASESTRVDWLDAGGNLRATQTLAGRWTVLGAGHDGSALLERHVSGEPSLLSLQTMAGNARWTRSLPERSSLMSALPLRGGDWLTLQYQYNATASPPYLVQRHRAADGASLWSKPVPFAKLHLAEAAGLVFVIDRDLPRRLSGIRLDNGEFDAVLAVDATPTAAQIRVRDNGSAIIAGVDGEGGRVVLASVQPQRPGIQAVPTDPRNLRGLWHDPASAGQGLLIDHSSAGATTFGAWFTYTVAGGHQRSEQRWYSLQGAQDGALARLTIYRNSGGQFGAGAATAAEAVGQAVLSLVDCDHAVLRYQFAAAVNDGASGVIPLRRTADQGAGPDCVRMARNGGVAGAWYDPARSGQGLLFEHVASNEGDVLAGGWFTYDPSGAADDPTAQHWFTLLGPWQEDGAELTILRTIGGSFDRLATNNTWRVGSARLQRSGCDRAELSYRFDGGSIAGSFAGRTGNIALRRIGGCASGR